MATGGDRLARHALADGDPTGWFERLYGAADQGSVSMPWIGRRRIRCWRSGQPIQVWSAMDVRPWSWEPGWVPTRNSWRSSGFGPRHSTSPTLQYVSPAVGIRPAPSNTVKPISSICRSAGSERSTWWEDLYRASPSGRRCAPARPPVLSGLVAPGGTLLVIYRARDVGEPLPDGPPWPLDREEISAFATPELCEQSVDRLPDGTGDSQWRAEFVKAR